VYILDKFCHGEMGVLGVSLEVVRQSISMNDAKKTIMGYHIGKEVNLVFIFEE